jgi:aminoglycoside phosphotransferase (APT) family kinase protein
VRPSIAERTELTRLALAELEPCAWISRVLESSPDGRAVVEYACDGRRVIGKFRADGAGAGSIALLRAVSAHATGTLRVPRPIAWLEPTGALLTEAATGVPCRTLDVTRSGAVLERVGRALAELHAMPLTWGTPKQLRDHVHELVRPDPRELAAALPAHAARITRALERMIAEEQAWHTPPFALLHRDFHLRQLFDDGEHVTVLDWDDAACGDPAFDVGYFTTYLKTHYEPAAADSGIASFRRGYGGDRALWSRRPTYERFNHLRRACRRFRLRDEGWERELERMLARLDD